MKKAYSFLKIGMVALFLMCCQLGHAQTWNDMVNWLQSSNGMRTLALLAHPSDGQKSNVEYNFVRSNSEEVVIKITYEGWFTYYTDTYTIKKGTYNGKPYFRRILIDEVWDPVTGAFMGMDRFGLGYALVYNGIPFSRLYGDVDFSNLSRGEKGAYALFAYFLDYYY